MTQLSSCRKPTRFTVFRRGLCLGISLLVTGTAFGDGNVVNKVYHPYVDALESELEYRGIVQDEQKGQVNPSQIHRLSYGRSFGNNLFGELNLIGARERGGSFDADAFELELKWQLTEQGEYDADFGMVFEYEQKTGSDVQELVAGFLVEKEIGRWSGAANLFLKEEWGDDIRGEFETAAALQARYRYVRSFEPAFELYMGQDTFALGPAVLGSAIVGTRKTVSWEAGVMFGESDTSPNTTFRFLLEFEF